MDEKISVLAMTFGVLAFTQPAYSQQTGTPARIGLLRTSGLPAVKLTAFRKGMSDRGHIEGKTYVLVPGWEIRAAKKKKPTYWPKC